MRVCLVLPVLRGFLDGGCFAAITENLLMSDNFYSMYKEFVSLFVSNSD